MNIYIKKLHLLIAFYCSVGSLYATNSNSNSNYNYKESVLEQSTFKPKVYNDGIIKFVTYKRNNLNYKVHFPQKENTDTYGVIDVYGVERLLKKAKKELNFLYQKMEIDIHVDIDELGKAIKKVEDLESVKKKDFSVSVQKIIDTNIKLHDNKYLQNIKSLSLKSTEEFLKRIRFMKKEICTLHWMFNKINTFSLLIIKEYSKMLLITQLDELQKILETTANKQAKYKSGLEFFICKEEELEIHKKELNKGSATSEAKNTKTTFTKEEYEDYEKDMKVYKNEIQKDFEESRSPIFFLNEVSDQLGMSFIELIPEVPYNKNQGHIFSDYLKVVLK